jgi:signal transduction histidine kinase
MSPESECEPRKLLVSRIVDNGVGIAPENILLALTPFGQIDSGLSREFEETGMGLPLSKIFVELHHG